MATEALVFGRLPACEPDSALVHESAGQRRVRVEIGATLIDQVDLASAVERIREFVWSGKSHQIVTVNLDFLSIAERNPAFRAAINGANLAVADGMPLVWISRLRGQPLPERVTGVALVEASCEVAAETGRGVFLLGAAPGVAEMAAERLEARHPGLRIVGTYSPPIGPLKRKENQRIVRMIRETKPGFLFVALGAPRQDLWIREHMAELDIPVAMGVGCVLDLLAGVSHRAPTWMQGLGLEWVYRLVREPRRLWRRYIVNDVPMFWRLLLVTARQQERRPLPIAS